MEVSQLSQVISGQYAFVALNSNAGSITCWGHSSYGGPCKAFRMPRSQVIAAR